MFLFLILAVPAWLYAVISLYPKPSRGWRGLAVPLIGGISVGGLALTITLGLLTRNPFGTDLAAAYGWAWYRGPGWMMTAVSAGLLLYYHFKPTSYSRIRELSLWYGGAALVYLFWYALVGEPGFDGYRLFIAPIIWMGSLGTIVWLADRGLRSDGWVSIVFYIFTLAAPSILTFLPAMSVIVHSGIVVGISILVLAGSMVLIHLDSRGRLS